MLVQVVALVMCAFAVATDVRSYRIPNELVAVGLLAGLVIDPSLAAILGGLVALVVFGVPAAFGTIGMGDVKLAVAVGTLLRWPLAISFLLETALTGGVVALVLGLLGQRRMPYALAIAAGCGWAIAAQYVPQLQVLGSLR